MFLLSDFKSVYRNSFARDIFISTSITATSYSKFFYFFSNSCWSRCFHIG